MIYKKVPIVEIDLRNDRFRISYMPHRKRLTESIHAIGLIHPIILRTINSTEYCQIISGFQRVQSCIDLNMKQIDSIIYSSDELSDAKALLLSLHQTVTSRAMNLIEKSLCLRKLSEIGHMEEATLITDIMPLLDLEPGKKIFQNVMRLWELDDHLKAYIVENNVALSNAALFSSFSREDQKNLFDLIIPLRLGTNKLKEFLTHIDEIRHRDEIVASQIIDSEMKTILADQNMPTPQKIETIRKRLKEKRFPALAALEKKIQNNLRQLKLPPELSLSIPPFLEGEKLKVDFSFKNEEELREIIIKLTALSRQKELETILEML
ncbi:MAG: ParB N-terminal domain-containing protein [Gemmatimonadota bacterium]|nr:MAG: ParB N-terminal domain-containing protein [Gemmatimonadota bacterium]